MFRHTPEAQPFQHFGGAGFTPADETNILGRDIVPRNAPSLLRIFIAIDAASKLYAHITRAGTTNTVVFNADTNLTADALYAFDMLLSTLDTAITFEINAQTAVVSLTMQEIFLAGQ